MTVAEAIDEFKRTLLDKNAADEAVGDAYVKYKQAEAAWDVAMCKQREADRAHKNAGAELRKAITDEVKPENMS